MELSGLIFVALALVWAVVLLPKALRHHDEVAQTRSVDDLSDGARVLARREAVSEREARLVVTAAPVATITAQRSGDRPVQVASPPRVDQVRARLSAQRKAAAAASARRRRILVLLVAVDLVVGAAAALGQLPVWAVSIPVTVTVLFLVTARVTVRRQHARFDDEMRALEAQSVAQQRTATPLVEEEAAPNSEAQATPPVVQELAVVSGLEETSSFPVGLLDEVTPTTDPGSLWDPLPMTLPTYVSKPRANRSVRTIDLQSPGVASSGHDAASSALVADAASSAASSAPPDDLPQRAVGS